MIEKVWRSRNPMRTSYIILAAGLSVAALFGAAANVSVAEEGWKTHAGTKTLIGSVLAPGTYLPVDSKESWKIQQRELFLANFNAGRVLSFPRSLWTGPEQYDFESFNEVVNWAEEHKITQIAHLLVGGDYYHGDWYSKAELSNEEL
jgi:hypothetical protein